MKWAVAFLVVVVLAGLTYRCWPRPDPAAAVRVDPPLAVTVAPSSPPYQPPTVTNAQLAVFVDRRRSSDERVTPDLVQRLRTVVLPSDLAAVAAVLADPQDDDTVRHEAAELLRRSGYAGLTDALLSILASPAEGPRFRSWSVQHLGTNLEHPRLGERGRIRDALRGALNHVEVETRREALLALARAGDPAGAQTAVTWLADTGPAATATHAIAIRCVQEVLDRRDQLPVVRGYASDTDEEVRIAALVALSQWGDQTSRPACVTAAAAASPRLRRCGAAAVARLDAAPR